MASPVAVHTSTVVRRAAYFMPEISKTDRRQRRPVRPQECTPRRPLSWLLRRFETVRLQDLSDRRAANFMPEISKTD